MDYIEKLEIQTKEVTKVNLLEKHTIVISEPVTVEKYKGHEEEYLPIDGKYDDGFIPIIHR